MIIFLDSNIILEDPSILAKKKQNVSLAITQSILTEFSIVGYHPKGESIYKLVDTAFKMGNIEVFPSQFPTDKQVYGYRISQSDVDLLQCAINIKNNCQDVSIATNDKYIIKIATHNGINTLNSKQLREIFGEKDVITDIKFKERTDRWSANQIKKLIFSILIAFVVGLSANILWGYVNKIISTIPIWGTIISIFLVGVGAYAIRGRYRLIYGLFEVFFGFFLVIRVFWPNFNYTNLQSVDYLQIIGSLYIMVRGQDNIGTGLKGRKYEYVWKRFSGEK